VRSRYVYRDRTLDPGFVHLPDTNAEPGAY
jgi:hypothetical protein